MDEHLSSNERSHVIREHYKALVVNSTALCNKCPARPAVRHFEDDLNMIRYEGNRLFECFTGRPCSTGNAVQGRLSFAREFRTFRVNVLYTMECVLRDLSSGTMYIDSSEAIVWSGEVF